MPFDGDAAERPVAPGRLSIQRASAGPKFTLAEENDDLAGNGDRHYTQDLRLSYTLAQEDTPHWATRLTDALPAFGVRSGDARLGFLLGQNIYTPRNIFSTRPVPFDLALTLVERSREFRGQDRGDRFGSISLNFKF